jgi:hypothetical protein
MTLASMTRIHFTINYRTNDKQKAQDFVDEYRQKAGIEIEELTIERYWKEKDQMQAVFFTRIASTRVEEKTFAILRLANVLAKSRYRWTFNGPYENEQLTFACIFNNDNKDEPLTWANIELED